MSARTQVLASSLHRGGRLAEENRLRSPRGLVKRLSFTAGAFTSTVPDAVVGASASGLFA
ncbi:hypothetical protein ACWC0C_26800 [Streptomyces sp. NPDC001709]